MALANLLAPDNNEVAATLQAIELLQLKGCVVKRAGGNDHFLFKMIVDMR